MRSYLAFTNAAMVTESRLYLLKVVGRKSVEAKSERCNYESWCGRNDTSFMFSGSLGLIEQSGLLVTQQSIDIAVIDIFHLLPK